MATTQREPARAATGDEAREITDLLYRAARLLDSGDHLGFVDLFIEDGTYKAIPLQNHQRGLPLGLIEDDRLRMLDRHEMLERYWSLEPTQTRHLVTNVEVAMHGPGHARVLSAFVVFVTGPLGLPEIQGLGRYEDEVVDRGAGWRFLRRLAVFDNHMIAHPISLPL